MGKGVPRQRSVRPDDPRKFIILHSVPAPTMEELQQDNLQEMLASEAKNTLMYTSLQNYSYNPLLHFCILPKHILFILFLDLYTEQHQN